MARSNINLSFTVKIAVRVINEDNGTGGPTRQEVLDEIDRLEAYYAPHDICFALMGIYSINDSDFASPADGFDGDTADDLIAAYPPLNDVITINVLPDYTFFRGTAYAIPNTYTTIYAGRFNTPHLAHEMGHCLGLYHTHETAFGDELVDGSNCSGAGDKLCDTPADPLLSGNVDASCIYTGTDTDANGDSYNPDVTNTMSYAPFDCRGAFTNDQEGRMHNILSGPFTVANDILVSQNILNLCCATVVSGFTHEAALESLTAQDYIVSNAAIAQFVAEETVVLKPGFAAQPGSSGLFRASINRFCDGDFPAGVPVSSLASGSTPWASPSIQQVHAGAPVGAAASPPTLFPNPVAGDLTVSWPRQEYEVRIHNASGQMVWASGRRLAGQQTIDTRALPAGTYFCRLQTQSASKLLKFIKL